MGSWKLQIHQQKCINVHQPRGHGYTLISLQYQPIRVVREFFFSMTTSLPAARAPDNNAKVEPSIVRPYRQVSAAPIRAMCEEQGAIASQGLAQDLCRYLRKSE